MRTDQLTEHIGREVTVAGWLHAVRHIGALSFMVVRDGWGLVQAVSEGDDATRAHIGLESVVQVQGLVTEAPQAPGGVELHAPRLTIISAVTDTLPVALHKRELRAGISTILDAGAVANRHPTRRAVLSVAAAAASAFRDHLLGAGFTAIHTPKVVASATESGANVFGVDYFGRPAFLAQSPQLYKQAMVGVFERVFEIGPVFRAEPHDTTRHLNEYTSLDAELGFVRDHFDVMAVLREVVAALVEHLWAKQAADLGRLAAVRPTVPPEVPHLHFADAQALLLERYGRDVRGQPDLSPADERDLGRWAEERYGSDFLFVTGFPMRKRPFYTHPDPARPEFSNSFDLLFRGMEIVTGGQRLHRYEDYVGALSAAGLPVEPFAWYLDVFRFGMPPHGGFAIGLERFVMQLLGLPNVRLAAAFPRDRNRVTP